MSKRLVKVDKKGVERTQIKFKPRTPFHRLYAKRKYEICFTCGAIEYGNFFCPECRGVMSKRTGIDYCKLFEVTSAKTD